MKKLLLSFFSLFFTFTVQAQYTSIPDQNFEKKLIELGHDDVLDGRVLTVDIETIATLDVSGYGKPDSLKIKDLTGIQDFKALIYLACSYNRLENLTIDKNEKLKILNCSYNQLFDLNLSQNLLLESLICHENKLVNLDVTKNTSLVNLTCSRNRIETLDFSKNKKIEILNCRKNRLNTLVLSENKLLKTLNCSYNQISELNLNTNTLLEGLSCSYNKLDELYLLNNPLLETLDCTSNQLRGISLSKNILLETIWCSKNNLEELDVSENLALKKLYCSNNKIWKLDISKNNLLEHLSCNNNRLINIQLENKPNLMKVYCDNNEIGSLDISTNLSLSILYCSDNKLTKLNVSRNDSLIQLNAGDNELGSLDLSNNTELTDLWINSNQLINLDLSKNINLRDLNAFGNSFTCIKVASEEIAKKANANQVINDGQADWEEDEGVLYSIDCDAGKLIVIAEKSYSSKNNRIYAHTSGFVKFSKHKINQGDSVEVTVFSKSGYKLNDLLVNGESYGDDTSLVLRNLQEDITVKAIFDLAYDFDGGDGTELNPFQISTFEQLEVLSNLDTLWDKHFILMSDIDAIKSQGINAGKCFRPIGSEFKNFTGSFDGNGKVIRNLYIYRKSLRGVGLFGWLDPYAKVKQIGLINTKVFGGYLVGALVGIFRYEINTISDGEIRECFASGYVEGKQHVGGLVGANGNKIYQSFANVDIKAEGYVGGLAGMSGSDAHLKNDLISESYASGSLYVNSTFSSSFDGAIAGWGFVSGIPNIENSYWDKHRNGFTVSPYLSDTLGLATSEFSNLSNFKNWDTSIWEMNKVEEIDLSPRPYLKWQIYGIPEYEVKINQTDGGQVLASSLKVSKGRNVTFSIKPLEGYHLRKLKINGKIVSISEGKYIFENVQADVVAEAIFEKIEQAIYYQLTTNISLHGSISLAKDSIESGESISFSVTASDGYQIQDVLVNGKSIGAVEKYTLSDIQEDKSIEAIFEKIEQPIYYQLTTNISLHGSISLPKDSIEAGESISFTVTANEDYQIQDVLINSKSIGAVESYTLSDIQEDKSIEAIFEKIEQPIYYQLITNISPHGSISLAKDSIESGESISFTVTANEDYQIQDVLINSKSIGAVETYILFDIQEDKNIEAIFEKIEQPIYYKLSTNISLHGSVSLAKDSIEAGESISFTVTANDGYQIQDVLINNKSIGAVGSYTLSNIQEDKTIEAVFVKKAIVLGAYDLENISIHPNPVKNKLTISGLHAGEKILIIDLQGNVLLSKISKTTSIEFDLTSLKTGVYFVSVEERVVQKILKQ